MSDARGLNHFCAFQFNWLNAEMLEQANAAAQKDGYQVNMDSVKQSGLEALLRDTRRY